MFALSMLGSNLCLESLLGNRNYDILAAVFSDALKFMHDDLGLIGNETE